MRWIFREISPNEVETEVTQRDQFRNDEVDLSDTVVREAIQNSLDAQISGEQVRVTFDLLDTMSRPFMEHLFTEQVKHAEAAGVVDGLDLADCSALVIEDFGTRGLTGKVDERDNDNFSDFWRRHGKSHKTGKSGGRWGLGKLVYSYASQLGAFFGVTFRDGDAGSYLMGQTVLNTHLYNGGMYAPHGFFADEVNEGPDKGLQIPFQKLHLTKLFENEFKLRRQTMTGLSVVIPYPRNEIRLDRMTAVGIQNYFFPILTEQLVLEFGNTVVNRKTLRETATRFVADKMDDAEKLFDFVEEAHELPEEQLHRLDTDWYKDWKLTEEDFEEAELNGLKIRFAAGELISLRLPMVIKRKDGRNDESYFDLYLKNDPSLHRGVDLYVRGGITVPGEAKFKHRKALGALVARDEAVSEFLGDAENAAHTKWNGRAEKLIGKYKYIQQTLSAIRNSLVQFLDVLLHAAEDEVEDALLDFFWAPKTSGTKRRKKRRSPDTPVIPVQPRPRPILVQTTATGFRLVPGPAAAAMGLPAMCRVTMAYDTLSGNPFKNYNPLDFDASDPKSLAIVVSGGSQGRCTMNEIEIAIDQPDFAIDVTGFDPERDVVTRVSLTEE